MKSFVRTVVREEVGEIDRGDTLMLSRGDASVRGGSERQRCLLFMCY